eukprot:TRINITY_DN3440_c0_g2_i1.p1 TRINITY_DN3440_c0_g2~~TRINITY_DN3440_c0_g2_i1.p1  ORF type:complete len:331 (-),score=120.97 TRINITY_DN3440_c0_g2_i1:40-1032(-)
MQISRERQEVEQEKSQLLIQKQELLEQETRIHFDRKKLRITKASLARLQNYIVDEERKNLMHKKELDDYGNLILKKREQLALQEKALKQTFLGQPLKKPLKPQEDKEYDISRTFSSKNKRSDNEELINASGVTAKFPNNTSNSKEEPRAGNYRREQELEDKLKGLEEEKAKLEAAEREAEAQVAEMQSAKANLAKKLEAGCSHFSFAKKDEVPDIGSEIHEVEVVFHESKQEAASVEEAGEENDSLEMLDGDEFLRRLNERIENNNMAHLRESSEYEIQNVNISQIDNRESFASVNQQDSSYESSVYQNSQLYDQPTKGKYGITPASIQD